MNLEENKNCRRDIREFNVPIPWGHIAVKVWGIENDPHVIVFHGRMDNAGSFDNLIPLLPNHFYYICVDLPGHGKSSHFPPHLPIHSEDFLMPCLLLVKYFKKEKYIFMGHSYGGQIAFLFSSVYPQFVEKLVTLDVLPLYTIETNKTVEYLRGKIEKVVKIQEKLSTGQPPSYTYEEALQRFCNTRYFGETLFKEAAEPMLKRSLIEKGDGSYYFSTDQRMKAYINPLHDMRYFIECNKLNPISVPVLIIFAKLNDLPRKRFARTLEQLQKNKNVTVLYVDGAHDVHNNYPQRVARYICQFLLLQNAKL